MSPRDALLKMIASSGASEGRNFSEKTIKEIMAELSLDKRVIAYHAIEELTSWVRQEVKCDHPKESIQEWNDGRTRHCALCKMYSYSETKFKGGFGGDKREWSMWE